MTSININETLTRFRQRKEALALIKKMTREDIAKECEKTEEQAQAILDRLEATPKKTELIEQQIDELEDLLVEVGGLKTAINVFDATEARAKKTYLKIKMGNFNHL